MPSKEMGQFSSETEYKIEVPKSYNVFLINDDYTTMDFVVEVIVNIFRKTASEATKIMLDVHNKGRGLVGTYSYDIAVTKTRQVETAAKEHGFPLKTDIEEV